MKNQSKMDQKLTKNQSKMDQKSIKNRPKSSIQNTPADAQPRTETHSQGLKKSSCRRTAKPPCRRTAKEIRNFPADAQSAKQWENTVKWGWGHGRVMDALWPGVSVRTPKLPFTIYKLPFTIYHLTLTHAVAQSAVADKIIKDQVR